MNQGKKCDCEPDFSYESNQYVHADGCDTEDVDSPRSIAAGEYMDLFSAYRRDKSESVDD